MEEKKLETIPIFFATDDNYVPFLAVSIKSLLVNASKDYFYNIHVLTDGINQENQEKLQQVMTPNSKLIFDDVSAHVNRIRERLDATLRDYYTVSIFYRLFIASLYPEYKKAIYLDCDIAVIGDISKMYNIDLGDNIVGAVPDDVIASCEPYQRYATEGVGVYYKNYFNSGVLVMNLDAYREAKIKERFVFLLIKYNFTTVCPDQDYLNVLCKGRVKYLERGWDRMSIDENYDGEIYLIHYNNFFKPWYYDGIAYEKYFWGYAKQTPYYEDILKIKENVSGTIKEKNDKGNENLLKSVLEIIASEKNFNKCLFAGETQNSTQSQDRLDVLKRIKKNEEEGLFDQNVENDIPAKELLPNEIDYKREKLLSKIKSKFSYFAAKAFLNKIIKDKVLVVDKIVGAENLKSLNSGAVFICNHFNPLDSFIMHLAYESGNFKKRKLYRVINEANYTSFPGFYGMLMRNFYTLPLSSNKDTMKLFLKAVNELLTEGQFVLVYAEQAMWWNYKKPRPLKKTAFKFSASNNVPTVPIFVTMKDGDKVGPDGFMVQNYVVNIGKPIMPNKELSVNENAQNMMEETFRFNKQVYESTYGTKLKYDTKDMSILPEYVIRILNED